MADELVNRFREALEHKINGRYDEAESLFKAILSDQPENAEAHHELGLVYSFKVFMDESIQELEAAVGLQPDSVNYLNSLAKTHTMFGDYDKAKPIFERVLQIDPFNNEANKNLDFLKMF